MKNLSDFQRGMCVGAWIVAGSILALILVVGCTSTPPAPIEEPKPITYKATWPEKEWTAILDQALTDLGADLLAANPKDLASYCPPAGARKQCYIGIISSLAKFESNYKPASSYQESFKDSKGNYVISRGLLQISQESANGYGCGIRDAKELHDVETNLRCGIRIMARWIIRDGVVAGGKTSAWLGMSRYWSPFRDAAKTKAIQDATKKLF